MNHDLWLEMRIMNITLANILELILRKEMDLKSTPEKMDRYIKIMENINKLMEVNEGIHVNSGDQG